MGTDGGLADLSWQSPERTLGHSCYHSYKTSNPPNVALFHGFVCSASIDPYD